MGHPNGFFGWKSLGLQNTYYRVDDHIGNNGTLDPRIASQSLLLDSTFTASCWIAHNPMPNHCYPSFLAKSFRSGNKTSNVRNIPAMVKLPQIQRPSLDLFRWSQGFIQKRHLPSQLFFPSTTCRRPNEFKPNFPSRMPALHTLDRRPWWCTRNFWSQWLRPDNGNHHGGLPTKLVIKPTNL